MKFTRVVLLCNLCWQETSGDVETPAERTLIFKTSDETDDFFRLDICLNHASNGTTLDELIAAAEAIDPATPSTHKGVGRPRGVVLGGTEPALVCPTCGKPIATTSGVSLHMRAMHPDAWSAFVVERDAQKSHKRKVRSQ